MIEKLRAHPITDVGGVDKYLGNTLSEQGYSDAKQLVGVFLVLDNNFEFMKWLQDQAKAAKGQQEEICKSLTLWCFKNLYE